MRKEVIVSVEIIPFKTFQEKIELTKKYERRYETQVIDDVVMIVRKGRAI